MGSWWEDAEHGGQEGEAAAGTGLLRGCEGRELPSALLFFPPQVDEIYHDESLGVHINIVLVRMIMVGYRQVRYLVSQQPCPAVLQPWGITVGFSRWNGLGRVSTGTFLLVSQVAFCF